MFHFPFIQVFFQIHLNVFLYLNTYYVSRSQAKVDDDGCESKKVAGTVVFMDPAAEPLQTCESPLELFSKGNQQQQHVGKQEDRKLEDGREQSAGEKKGVIEHGRSTNYS